MTGLPFAHLPATHPSVHPSIQHLLSAWCELGPDWHLHYHFFRSVLFSLANKTRKILQINNFLLASQVCVDLLLRCDSLHLLRCLHCLLLDPLPLVGCAVKGESIKDWTPSTQYLSPEMADITLAHIPSHGPNRGHLFPPTLHHERGA